MKEQEIFELTNPQKSIYYTEQMYKGSSITNISGTVHINEKIDFEKLREAGKLLFKNNDALREKIVIKENIPFQYFEEYNKKDIEEQIEIIEVENENELDSVIKKLLKISFIGSEKYLAKLTLFKYPDGTGGCNIIHSHIISDAWTSTLECSEIVEYYISALKNTNLEKDSNLTYKNFIKSEQEYYKSEKYEKDKKYWYDKFETVPQIATTNNKNIESKNCSANRIKYILDENKSNQIEEFCQKNKISVYCFFITIYSIYLSRINNINRVVLGTPLLNRKGIKEKNTFGMYVNTLPICIDIKDESNMVDIFNETTKEVLSILRHQRFSYLELLKHVREKFDFNRGLYDVIISYQNAKTKADSSEILYNAEWNFNGNISETLNIHISDIDNTNKLNIYYDYQVEKHTEKDIDNIHNRVLFIADQIIKNAEMNAGEIDIVPENEKRIINLVNMENVNYPFDKTVVDLFEEQVEKTPDNIAVTFKGKTITYKELNQKANALAKLLINKGIKKGDRVALRINKSIEMIVSIIAIIKVGASYVPIDLSYPRERIEFIIKDSSSKILLTNKESNEYKDIIDFYEIDVNELEEYKGENIKCKINPTDVIYIIYTSGSTGIPKGVMIMHENVVRLLKNDKFQFDFDDKDVWTMFHSVAFDFSVWEMYGALLYGGKLVLVPENIAKDPNEFLKLLRKENVTVLNQTPTYFYNLLDCEMKKQDKELKIRYIIYGGEALKPVLIKGWKEKYPFTKLINMYGITETTVHVTYKELNESNLNSSDSNIGKPIPTLKTYILDEKQRLLPIGIEGELCVAGKGVCKGYLNRPELNKVKFIESPFDNSDVLYRSADSGYIGEDGNLYYIGRIDTQVKIRGFRVELGEIETKLLRHPAISKCVVLDDKKSDKDSHLVAYIVCEEDVSIDKLKEYLKPLVPPYMIPNYFVKIDKMPLNSNGKVDRKYLKTLNYTLEQDSEHVEPRNELEKCMVDIIQKELNINKIGIDDDIIRLGADSLSLMRITAGLLENDYNINIQLFYEYKTIRKISEFYNLNNMDIENVNELKNNIYFDTKERELGNKIIYENVMLTGATGFLGIHILYDLLMNTNSNIYCLIRDKDGIDGKTRLINKIKFYFEKDKDEIIKCIDQRIHIIKGDVSQANLGIENELYTKLGYKIDILIHSAAIVNHYGEKEKFNLINVEGTKNVIKFCKEYHVKLNHISTISVSADFIINKKLPEAFTEKTLYIGQPYSKNIYVKTKFEAEYLIWKERNNGLEFAIYRMGNITSRAIDGKFQENDYQNAFLNRMLSFIKMGATTEKILCYEFDMSPVDYCSKFVVEAMKYDSSYNQVFHVFNNNTITLKNILDILDIREFKILSKKDLLQYIKVNKEKIGIINDITSTSLEAKNIEINSEYSEKYFKSIGLEWNKIDDDYIKKYVSLGDKKDENIQKK